MVESNNIRPPSDNRLLADGVRVLARTVVHARKLVKQVMQAPFEDFTQTAKQLVRQIGETLRKKTEAAKSAGRQQYQELLEMTRKTVRWAHQTRKHLQRSCDAKAQRLAQTLETFLPHTEQVIDQTLRRIVQSEQVPALEKIVSLFRRAY